MKVIAVHTAATRQGVVDVLDEIQQNGPPNGWRFIGFSNALHLLEQLTQLGQVVITQLEIVSEGSPEHLDGVELHPGPGRLGPARFGGRLKKVPGIKPQTIVFLSGCNTGCFDEAGGTPLKQAIAQTIAVRARVSVRGARGYITGTHAHRNEEVTPDDNGHDIEYEGAVSGTVHGSRAWRPFPV